MGKSTKSTHARFRGKAAGKKRGKREKRKQRFKIGAAESAMPPRERDWVVQYCRN